jgi:lysophospholipase L1-like esterase
VVQLAEKAYITARRGNVRRVPPEDFRRNLEAMVETARAHAIEPVLITAPSSHVQGKEPEYLRGRWLRDLSELVPLHRRYVEAVRGVARERKVVLCDLAALFDRLPPERRAGSFQKDGIHFNRRGAARAARWLDLCLEESGVLDRALSDAARKRPGADGPRPAGTSSVSP